MTTEIIKTVDPKEYGLEEKKAESMVSGLNVTIEERRAFEKSYKEVLALEITEENIPTFKRLRLDIRSNRVQIEKWHKANKAFYLAGGRFVDAVKNKEVAVNEQMESKLMDAEKHFENLEKERLEELQSKRESELSKYVEDATERDLSGMDDDVWGAFISTKKTQHQEKLAAEKKDEEERIAKEKAEKAEQERIRKENERLKKEADERERLAKIEQDKRDKAEAARKAKEEKARKEREAKATKEKAEYEAKLKKEAEKKAKIAAQLKAKQDAEVKAKEEAEEKAAKDAEEKRKAELAPQKEKVSNWVNSFELPDLIIKGLDKGAVSKAHEITKKFEAFKKWALKEIESVK